MNMPHLLGLLFNCLVLSFFAFSYQSAETVAHGTQQGWVDASHPPMFTGSGDSYFLLLPVEDGVRGAFKQVVMVDSAVIKRMNE